MSDPPSRTRYGSPSAPLPSPFRHSPGRLAFGLDSLSLQLFERLLHVVDRQRDVAVPGAVVVVAPVVVVRQLEDRFLVADAEEVVRRLELAVPDDVHLALEAEAERLVEAAAASGVG